MLTFLTSPKSFTGHAGNIQRNAIRSWLAVYPDVEIIIYGDGEGVSEACQALEVRHVPDTPCSPSGVPYFNGIVEHAKTHARYDTQCYLNCDILLTPHIVTAISCIPFSPYLMIGQRIDLAEGADINISGDWKGELEYLAERGLATLHAPSGIDYFIFSRGMWDGLLPLVIGRAGYDGALLAFCLRHKIPIIDGTLVIPALHQFHDYGHVTGARNEVWRGKDAADNINLHGVRRGTPIISDANLILDDNNKVIVNSNCNLLRCLELKTRFVYGLNMCALMLRVLYRSIRTLGFFTPDSKNISTIVSNLR